MDKVYRKKMAQWLGIAQNSLIYLEKKNFIPTEREENGYRYYRGDAAARLLLYRHLRSFGFDINEAVDVFYAKSNEEVFEKLEQREAALEAEKRLIEQKLYALERCKSRFQEIPEMEAALSVCSMPEIYLLRSKVQEHLNAWIDAMPIVRPCFEIAMEERPWLDLDFGYMVDKRDLEDSGLSLDMSHAEAFHCGKAALHGYVPLVSGKEEQDQVSEYLAKHQIERTGTILCAMTEKICYDTRVHVLEVWVPTE